VDSITDIRRRPSMLSMVVWVLFCGVMWLWAFGGPLILVGIGSELLYSDPPMDIEAAVQRQQHLRDLGVVAGMSVVGLAFVVLRLQGHIRFGDRD
jgi:hypothetical protein